MCVSVNIEVGMLAFTLVLITICHLTRLDMTETLQAIITITYYNNAVFGYIKLKFRVMTL